MQNKELNLTTDKLTRIPHYYFYHDNTLKCRWLCCHQWCEALKGVSN